MNQKVTRNSSEESLKKSRELVQNLKTDVNWKSFQKILINLINLVIVSQES